MKILIVEDHRAVRTAVERLLREEGLDPVAVATCSDARRELAAQRFDAALVDLGLPDGDGIELVEFAVGGGTPVLVFTVFDGTTIDRAMEAGARGYVLKDEQPAELASALAAVAAGSAFLSPSAAERVLRRTRTHTAPPENLTQREVELLAALARGLTYSDAAESLGVAHGTVQTYVKTLYRKLDVTSKAEAAVLAVRWGIVEG